MLNEEKSFIAMCKFLAWLSFALFITFFGLSHTLAYTWEDIGYQNTNSQVYADTNYLGSPIQLTRLDGTKYFTGGNEALTGLTINVNQLNLDPSNTYQFEVYLPNTILSLANTASVTWGGANNTNGSCNVLSTLFTNNYPQITFKCATNGNNITYLSVKYFNTSNSAIISGGTYLQWNYVFMRRQVGDEESGTQDIINNQNQNTQDIINNQNQNTNKEIESQKVCKTIIIDKNYIKEDNKYLDTNGNYVANNAWGVTDYVNVIHVIQLSKVNVNTSICFYNESKSLISCSSNSGINNGTIILPSNTYYFRASIYKEQNIPTYEVESCKNGNQSLSDDINNLNDSLTDDDTTDATNEASDFFSDFSTNTFGLTSIVTAPLNLIQSLTSSTCTQLHLPLPYLTNKYLDLPCMSAIYSQYFGTFFTLYQTITYGIIAYWICVRIFNQVKDFKNPEHDEIEVLDL